MIWKVNTMKNQTIDRTEQINLEKLEEMQDREKRENPVYSPF